MAKRRKHRKSRKSRKSSGKGCYLRKKSKGSRKKIRVCPTGASRRGRRNRHKGGFEKHGRSPMKCTRTSQSAAESLASAFKRRGKDAQAVKLPSGSWAVCHR